MLPEGIDGGRPSSIPDKREPAGKGMLVAFIPCLLTAGGILEYENTWSYCFFFLERIHQMSPNTLHTVLLNVCYCETKASYTEQVLREDFFFFSEQVVSGII